MRGQEHVLIWGRCIFVTVEVRMRVAILTVILVGFFGSAAAKWVEVAGNESSTVYADSDTIRKTGDTVKIWTLVDYKAVVRIDSSKSYLSQKSQQEYDCKAEQTRMLYFSFHSKNMGNGVVLYHDADPDKWFPVPPGSMEVKVWKFACGK